MWPQLGVDYQVATSPADDANSYGDGIPARTAYVVGVANQRPSDDRAFQSGEPL